MSSLDLDDPSRLPLLRRRILGKAGLRAWYGQVYARWARALAGAPRGGLAVELGSGAGFAKQSLPGLRCTDIIAYPGLDAVVDANRLPWRAGALRALFGLNVFHHLADPARFLREAARVLKPGGVLALSDQHPGWLASPILRFLHHEPFDPSAESWRTTAKGSLAGANGALAWIAFRRDRELLARAAPGLRVESYETFSPLLYWVSGGLKAWSLAPTPLVGAWQALDALLLRLSPQWGSFCHVVLRRR